jgi:hypothetical protein
MVFVNTKSKAQENALEEPDTER